ncbi:MAG: dephospho-CoA kinase [Litoreibacter sp.]
MKKPLVVGLTGSIGMGKSVTAGMFADLGVPVWDADAAVARLYESGCEGATALAQIAPDAVGDKGVDREKLKAIIANKPEFLKQIEAVIHPLVMSDRMAFLSEHIGSDLVLLDIPLLFEKGFHTEVDNIVVVSTTSEQQRERVMARGTMDEAAFAMILSKQMPDSEKRKRADYIIETTTIASAREQVHKILTELRGS